MGAPKRNTNRLLHGKYSFLSNAKLPKGAAYIAKRVAMFHKQLTIETAARHGDVGIYHAALIQSAGRHETRARLLIHWLRKLADEGKEPPLGERLAVLKEIGNASDSRDKCLKLLGLDTSKGSNPADIYSPFVDAVSTDEGTEAEQAAAGDSDGPVEALAANDDQPAGQAYSEGQGEL